MGTLRRPQVLAVLGCVAACTAPARVEIEPIGTITSASDIQVIARVVDHKGRRDPDAVPPVLMVEPADLAVISPGSRLRCLRDGSGLLEATAGVLKSRIAFVCSLEAP